MAIRTTKQQGDNNIVRPMNESMAQIQQSMELLWFTSTPFESFLMDIMWCMSQSHFHESCLCLLK